MATIYGAQAMEHGRAYSTRIFFGSSLPGSGRDGVCDMECIDEGSLREYLERERSLLVIT